VREEIISLPDPVPPTRAVRGTVIVRSQQLMRQLGREEEYWANLDDQQELALREILVSSWVPIDLCIAHYGAIDRLGLDPDVAFRNGVASGEKITQAFVGTLIRSMRAAGTITPMTLLSRYDKLYGRLVEGGAVRVSKLGPKDARAEMHEQPLARFDYIIEGWRGVIQSGFDMMSKKVFVKQGPSPRADTIVYDVSWV
jgi:hypothetical protein